MTRSSLVFAAALLLTTMAHGSDEVLTTLNQKTQVPVVKALGKPRMELGKLPLFKLVDNLKPFKSKDSKNVYNAVLPGIKLLMDEVIEAQTKLAEGLFELTAKPDKLKRLDPPYEILIGEERFDTSDFPKALSILLQNSNGHAVTVANRIRFGLFRQLFALQLLLKQLELTPNFSAYAARVLKDNIIKGDELELSHTLAFAEHLVCYGDLLFHQLDKLKGGSFLEQFSKYEDAEAPIRLVNLTLKQPTDGIPLHVRYLWLSTLLMQYVTDSKLCFEAYVDARIEERCYRFPAEANLQPLALTVQAHLMLPVEIFNLVQQQIKTANIEEKKIRREIDTLSENIRRLKHSNLGLMQTLKIMSGIPENPQDVITENQRIATELTAQAEDRQRELAQIMTATNALKEQCARDQEQLHALDMAEAKAGRQEKLQMMIAEAQASLDGVMTLGTQIQAEITHNEEALATSLSDHQAKLLAKQEEITSTEREIKEVQDLLSFGRSEKKQKTETLELTKRAQADAALNLQRLKEEEDAADAEIRQLEEELSAVTKAHDEVQASVAEYETNQSELEKIIQGLEETVRSQDKRSMDIQEQLKILNLDLSKAMLDYARWKAFSENAIAQANCIRHSTEAAEARLNLACDFGKKILGNPMLFISQITVPFYVGPGRTLWPSLEYLFELVQEHMLTEKAPNNTNE